MHRIIAIASLSMFATVIGCGGTTTNYFYLGDNGADWFGGLAVDASGNAYLAASSYPPGYYFEQPLGTGQHWEALKPIFHASDGVIVVVGTLAVGLWIYRHMRRGQRRELNAAPEETT